MYIYALSLSLSAASLLVTLTDTVVLLLAIDVHTQLQIRLGSSDILFNCIEVLTLNLITAGKFRLVLRNTGGHQ
jgi:hypothetical protein